MTTATLDPRIREALEHHEELTRQRLTEQNPAEWGRLTAQMSAVRLRILELETRPA